MILKFFQSIGAFLPANFRAISLVINVFVRGMSVVSTLFLYLAIKKVFPDGIAYQVEISIISAVVLSIVLIIPLQEFAEFFLKRTFLSEYLFDDPLTLKVVSKRLEYDSLISNVFPDMVKLSGSKSGRIAVLNRQNNGFNIYTYSRGKQNKVKKKNYNINEALIDVLRKHNEGLSIDQCVKYPGTNDYFISLKANYILPLIYQKKFFGFLALSNIPVAQDKSNLMILASKAALAIYNQILSFQIAVHVKYKREIEVASKIEKLIFTRKMPTYPHFEFQTSKEKSNILIEFFSSGTNHIFVLLTLGINRIGSSLVVSYILGTLYSQSLMKKRQSPTSIKNLIDEKLKELSWSETYELLIGAFSNDSDEITIENHSLNFKIFSEQDASTNYLATGWKVSKQIKDEMLNIVYKNTHILSIKRIPKIVEANIP